MSSTELTIHQATVNVDDLGRIAKMLALSGYFKTTGNLEIAIAQMATKVLAGREMGFGPFASATGIEIIQGRPAVGARLIAAAIKANPRYNYRIRRADAEECTIEFFENGESVGMATYTIVEAKGAGLTTKDNWKGYPSDMLFARCISRGQRRFCPDVFSGASVYTPEELGADVDAETGEMIEATARTLPAHPEQDFVMAATAPSTTVGTGPQKPAEARKAPNGQDSTPDAPSVAKNGKSPEEKFVAWCTNSHRNSHGPCTPDMYGYLAGLLDAICDGADAHKRILSALSGSDINHDNRPGHDLAASLLRWLPEKLTVTAGGGPNPQHKPDYVSVIQQLWRELTGQLALPTGDDETPF